MNAAIILLALAGSGTADLQATLERMRLEQEVPGVSVVLTRGDEVLFAGASGVANLETERRMTPDTVLYAGSLTKVLTAVLTLQLAEHGELSLNEVVTGIATETSNHKVRVRHLLMHTSGLQREGDFGYWFSADFPDQKALSRYLRDTELRTPPGSASHYSNIGYATLGAVIERTSEQSYHTALRQRVLAPLAMASSGSPGPAANVAAGYSPPNRVIPSAEQPFAGLGRRIGERRVREYHDANAMTPAFGAYTSAMDLSRLCRFLLGYGGTEVLSEAMRLKMLTPQAFGRGLGLRVGRHNGRRVARHGGWFAAHQSYLHLDLDSGISVAVLTNSDSATPGLIAEALIDQVLNAEQPRPES